MFVSCRCFMVFCLIFPLRFHLCFSFKFLLSSPSKPEPQAKVELRSKPEMRSKPKTDIRTAVGGASFSHDSQHGYCWQWNQYLNLAVVHSRVLLCSVHCYIWSWFPCKKMTKVFLRINHCCGSFRVSFSYTRLTIDVQRVALSYADMFVHVCRL